MSSRARSSAERSTRPDLIRRHLGQLKKTGSVDSAGLYVPAADLRVFSAFTAVAYGLKWRRRQKMITIRKRYRILVLAALVAAVIVPLGFALSLDSNSDAVAAPTA